MSEWRCNMVRVIVAWLSVCRVTAIISLVLQLVSLALFIMLVVCGVSQFVSCPAVQDQLCQRVLLYATPVTSITAGKTTRHAIHIYLLINQMTATRAPFELVSNHDV